MKYVYDAKRDVLTFVFRELQPGEEPVRCEAPQPGLVAYLDTEGKCISFDLFPAKTRWKSKREFKKLFENVSSKDYTFSGTFTD